MSSARTCGSCTACCKSIEVAEFNKPAGKWCTHCQIGKGCGIYANRPVSCKDFRCEWLKGLDGEEERPDRSKVIFDFVVAPNGLPGGQLQIWEVREGALGQELVNKRTAWALSSGIWVFHIPLNGPKHIFCPPGKRIPEKFLQPIQDAGMKIIVTLER